jgi:hypothetical protein
MKASLYIALIALTTTVSISAHAIPPIPPSSAAKAPVVITCRDLNSYDEEDLAELDNLEIVSFDELTREICTTEKN